MKQCILIILFLLGGLFSNLINADDTIESVIVSDEDCIKLFKRYDIFLSIADNRKYVNVTDFNRCILQAEAGNENLQYQLALFLYPYNQKLGFEMLLNLAELENIQALNKIAELYIYVRRDYKNEALVVREYRGEPDRIYFYYFPGGTARYVDEVYPLEQSYEKSFYYYSKAAELGSDKAQIFLGVMYHTGWGTQENPKEAIVWYKKAAEQGNAEAQKILGESYYNGWGIPQDYQEARKWYEKAAVQGDLDALLTLSIIYKKGLGVDVDLEKSKSYLDMLCLKVTLSCNYFDDL